MCVLFEFPFTHGRLFFFPEIHGMIVTHKRVIQMTSFSMIKIKMIEIETPNKSKIIKFKCLFSLHLMDHFKV